VVPGSAWRLFLLATLLVTDDEEERVWEWEVLARGRRDVSGKDSREDGRV
jgi:hypothetical protein